MSARHEYQVAADVCAEAGFDLAARKLRRAAQACSHGPVVHFSTSPGRMVCDRAMYAGRNSDKLLTDDLNKVTCRRCLRSRDFARHEARQIKGRDDE